MSESYILYNPLAGNGRCESAAQADEEKATTRSKAETKEPAAV